MGMQPRLSRLDIYNDYNCDLVNLFLCARECTIQLLRELKFLPLHSRAEFELLREFMKHKQLLYRRVSDEQTAVQACFSGEECDQLLQILQERSALFDVQRAAAYYKLCRGSFSGTTTSFGVKPNDLTIWFYAGYLHAEDAGAYLPRILNQMLEGTLGVFAERIGRQLFKLAVEQNVNNHILASDTDIDAERYMKMRALSMEQVRGTNGRISFADVLRQEKAL